MPRSGRHIDPDVDPEEEESEAETAPPAPSKKHAALHHGRPGAKGRRRGLRAWDDPAGGNATDGEESDDADDGPPEKERVYFRARDAWWFEPLVALMVIAVLLVSLFAYTSNWPPVYVVESESMQHGYSDQVGLINTGDLVLAQHQSIDSIVPYVIGMRTGYSTYGEPGDVILYHPFGDTSGAPIIHRALLYMGYNPSDHSYSFPTLAGLPCGNASNAVYAVDTGNGCATTDQKGTLYLYGIGWQSAEVDVPLDGSILGQHSGYLTMGDNNFDTSNGSIGVSDQVGDLSTLVEGGWVIGVARGMIPWFGSLKLALDGHAEEVPPQSWQYMGLTIVVLFAAALGFHLFLRREGFEDERRELREEQEEAEAKEEQAEARERPPHRGLRFWASADEQDDEEEDAPRGAPARAGRSAKEKAHDKPAKPSRGRGRPLPKVGREPADDDEL